MIPSRKHTYLLKLLGLLRGHVLFGRFELMPRQLSQQCIRSHLNSFFKKPSSNAYLTCKICSTSASNSQCLFFSPLIFLLPLHCVLQIGPSDIASFLSRKLPMQIKDQEVESLGAIANATLSLLLIFPFFKGTSLYIFGLGFHEHKPDSYFRQQNQLFRKKPIRRKSMNYLVRCGIN